MERMLWNTIRSNDARSNRTDPENFAPYIEYFRNGKASKLSNSYHLHVRYKTDAFTSRRKAIKHLLEIRNQKLAQKQNKKRKNALPQY